VLADLVAAKPVLPTTGPAIAWLASLSLVLTVMYIAGVIVRPSRPHRLGPESILALLFYVVELWGCFGLPGEYNGGRPIDSRVLRWSNEHAGHCGEIVG